MVFDGAEVLLGEMVHNSYTKTISSDIDQSAESISIIHKRKKE